MIRWLLVEETDMFKQRQKISFFNQQQKQSRHKGEIPRESFAKLSVSLALVSFCF